MAETRTEDEDRTDYARSEAGVKFHKEAAEKEPAWQGVGLEAGIKIFRIEYFQVVAVEEDTYGKFFMGDSYIVLETQIEGDSKKLIHHIYFWIGKESSLDEQSTAAYKTVELDDFFGGEPIQHRERHAKESEEFKKLFPNGIEYLEGGCPTGFRHVVPEGYEPKLYRVRKYKKEVTTFRVPLKTSALIAGDCFVLDTESAIYVLDGPESDNFEKFAANKKAEEIESERAGKINATHHIGDAFWSALEGPKPSWATPEIGGYVHASDVPPAAPDVGGGGVYPLEVLKAGCPAGVLPSAKEQSLSDADFQEAFGMPKDEFGKMPKWKQDGLKKKTGLF